MSDAGQAGEPREDGHRGHAHVRSTWLLYQGPKPQGEGTVPCSSRAEATQAAANSLESKVTIAVQRSSCTTVSKKGRTGPELLQVTGNSKSGRLETAQQPFIKVKTEGRLAWGLDFHLKW